MSIKQSYDYHPIQTRNKVVLIRSIGKDFTMLNTAADDMLQHSGCIFAYFIA